MFGKLMAGGALTPETITGYGQELKLNMKRFDKCLTGKKIIAAIEKDKEEGAKLGVGSTPVFFINGRVITGAYPFEVFKTIIEEELNKKQK